MSQPDTQPDINLTLMIGTFCERVRLVSGCVNAKHANRVRYVRCVGLLRCMCVHVSSTIFKHLTKYIKRVFLKVLKGADNPTYLTHLTLTKNLRRIKP